MQYWDLKGRNLSTPWSYSYGYFSPKYDLFGTISVLPKLMLTYYIVINTYMQKLHYEFQFPDLIMMDIITKISDTQYFWDEVSLTKIHISWKKLPERYQLIRKISSFKVTICYSKGSLFNSCSQSWSIMSAPKRAVLPQHVNHCVINSITVLTLNGDRVISV